MGTLFPNSREYPDHQPVPSSFPRVSPRALAHVAAVALVLYPLCPKYHGDHHEHAPDREFVPDPLPLTSLSAFGSSSGANPLTWQNRSMFDAADVAIRNHHARRNAQARVAQMSAMSSTGGSAGLDWLPVQR